MSLRVRPVASNLETFAKPASVFCRSRILSTDIRSWKILKPVSCQDCLSRSWTALPNSILMDSKFDPIPICPPTSLNQAPFLTEVMATGDAAVSGDSLVVDTCDPDSQELRTNETFLQALSLMSLALRTCLSSCSWISHISSMAATLCHSDRPFCRQTAHVVLSYGCREHFDLQDASRLSDRDRLSD